MVCSEGAAGRPSGAPDHMARGTPSSGSPFTPVARDTPTCPLPTAQRPPPVGNPASGWAPAADEAAVTRAAPCSSSALTPGGGRVRLRPLPQLSVLPHPRPRMRRVAAPPCAQVGRWRCRSGRNAAAQGLRSAHPAAAEATHTVLRRPGCRPGGCANLCRGETLAAIYRTYRGPLLRQARTILRDPGLAEEVVQETFVRAWRACPSFDPDGSPMLVWLSVIMRNLALDRMRARGRRPGAAALRSRRGGRRFPAPRRRGPADVAGGTARGTGPPPRRPPDGGGRRPSCWTDRTRTSPPSSVYRWGRSGAGPTTPSAGCGGSSRPKTQHDPFPQASRSAPRTAPLRRGRVLTGREIAIAKTANRRPRRRPRRSRPRSSAVSIPQTGGMLSTARQAATATRWQRPFGRFVRLTDDIRYSRLSTP